jgi:hypothetical protein
MPAPLGELGRLHCLGEPEEAAVESPRFVLATGGHGELNVIDAHHAHRSISGERRWR